LVGPSESIVCLGVAVRPSHVAALAAGALSPRPRLGRGRQVRGGVWCGLRIALPTSTRGNHMVRARGLLVLTAATLVAFACGGGGGGGGGTNKGTIKIGSDLPTTCTSGGKGAENGIKFAVTQKPTVEGFTIQFQGS